MAKLTMVQAINLALKQELAKDRRVLVFGEDVGLNGGVFRVTEGLQQEFGKERVFDTPIAESAIVGAAIGMALAGLRPVCEIQFSGFAFLAMAQLEGNAARLRSRTHGEWTVPMVLRMPYGGGIRALEHHSESREATFASCPGLKVVIPSGPRNARALLVSAIRDPDAVVFMEPKRSYRAFREEVPDEEETIDIGKASIVQEGKDLTLIAWGAMMPSATQAAHAVQERRSCSIELIDLLTISPLDSDTIMASVRKTGRCVIAQEAPRSFATSSEIVARINDHALMMLQAPVKRVTSPDVITPYFRREDAFMPSRAQIEHAIDATLDF